MAGKFIMWESESQQILEILKNCQTHWQRWAQSGHGSGSSCLSPHTLHPSCQVAFQLILIQPLVLARFRERKEIIPSGSDEKRQRAECHQHTDGTAAKTQLPRKCSSGAVTERVWWDAPLSLLTREKLS